MLEKKQQDTAKKSIVRRIHETLDSLPTGERRIADVILSGPAELAVMTASELAERAGVSNATVSRFCRRIDYSSFDEARQDARRLRATGSPLFTGPMDGKRNGPLSELVQQEASLIEATLSRINPLALREIGKAIAAAPRIRTLGYRNSHFLSQYLTAQLAQMRTGVAPLLLPGQTRAEGVAALEQGDLAIIVGLRRRPRDFVETVRAISERGAQILLVADNSIRVAPALARWTIDCLVATPQVVDSYVGALSVLRLIIIEADNALGRRGNEYLERVETLRERLGELE